MINIKLSSYYFDVIVEICHHIKIKLTKNIQPFWYVTNRQIICNLNYCWFRLIYFFIRIVFFTIFYFRIIMAVRDTCADWLRGVEPQDDPAMRGKKEDEGFNIKVPRRNVGPSTTQVWSIYMIIYSFTSNKQNLYKLLCNTFCTEAIQSHLYGSQAMKTI